MARRSKDRAGSTSSSHVFRYRQLAGEIEKRILDGTYQPGEKLPSIRRLHRQSNLSISTVFQAYMELGSTGLVEARARSGYYVLPVSLHRLEAPVPGKKSSVPQRVTLAPVINSVVGAGRRLPPRERWPEAPPPGASRRFRRAPARVGRAGGGGRIDGREASLRRARSDPPDDRWRRAAPTPPHSPC